MKDIEEKPVFVCYSSTICVKWGEKGGVTVTGGTVPQKKGSTPSHTFPPSIPSSPHKQWAPPPHAAPASLKQPSSSATATKTAQESSVLFPQRAGIEITHGHLNACCAHLNIMWGQENKSLIPHFAGKHQLQLQGDGDGYFCSKCFHFWLRGIRAAQGDAAQPHDGGGKQLVCSDSTSLIINRILNGKVGESREADKQTVGQSGQCKKHTAKRL